VLYWLLCGKAPHESANIGEMLIARLTEDPETPSAVLGRALPPDLEAIALRSLRKEPGERYANAAEVDDALSGCADSGRWRPTSTGAPITGVRRASEGDEALRGSAARGASATGSAPA
jgi:hypothetical protein